MENARYGHYNEIVQAGYAYLRGEITIGLFEEAVNRVLLFLKEGEEEFMSIELPPDADDNLRNDFEVARKGFAFFKQGISKVKAFVDEKKEDILWQGLFFTQLGCDLLNEAIKGQEDALEPEEDSDEK